MVCMEEKICNLNNIFISFFCSYKLIASCLYLNVSTILILYSGICSESDMFCVVLNTLTSQGTGIFYE